MKRVLPLLTLVLLAPLVCAQEKKPNVLFIAIDDLNDWVGPLKGHPQVQTPHMDRLAKRGVTFTNAHCQAPVCNPSRTSLMLGLRPSLTGVYGLAPWFRNVESLKDQVSLAQYFEKADYKTMAGGKIYHGGKRGREKEFQVWGPNAGVGAKPAQKIVDTPSKNPLVDWGVFPHRDEDKGDWKVASWAVDQLGQEQPEPFFLAVGFFLPHVPCYATQKWFDLYPEDSVQMPPYIGYDRDDLPRFASYMHWDLPEPRLSWLKQAKEWKPLVRAYLATVSFVDSQVGRVLDALDASGEADNTIIVLWSDHGWHLGEKGISGKNTLRERSTRVPLIFAGPGIQEGQSCNEPAELLDLYPTLTELCGLPPKEGLHGHSLTPQLKNPATKRDWPAITTHNPHNHSVVTTQWRYIRYADGSEELYNIKEDPNEWANLASVPGHEGIKAELRQWLPGVNRPPAPGSAHRILTYSKGTAIWEGQEVEQSRQDLPGDVPEERIFASEPKEILSSGAGEGPAWRPGSGLVFSGHDNILALNSEGQTSTFLAGAGSNGLLVDRNESLLVCEPKFKRVTRLDAQGNRQILTDSFSGKAYNSPNDISVDSKGRIYFSDPRYGPREGMAILDDQGVTVEGVYRVDLNGQVSRIITHEVDRPNGVLVSPDDRYLYVSDNNNNTLGGARKLWRFDLQPDGHVDLASRKLLYDWGTTRGPDGMAQDVKGRLYVAAGLHVSKPPFETAERTTSGIYVFSPEGHWLDYVPIPTDEVTNCSFGDQDWKTLYITAGGHLWSLRTTTPGFAPVAKHPKKPTFLYSRHFNAKGEKRYLPEGAYKEVLHQLGQTFDLVFHDRALTQTELAGVDVVLISNPSAKAVGNHPPPPRFSAEAIANLIDYIKQGGGLILMGNQENHNLENETTNELMSHFGIRWVDQFTDAKALVLPNETPIIGGLRWAYYTGNLLELSPGHRAKPTSLVSNDLNQKPEIGTRDQAGCLLAIAELGKGRLVVVTDSGWINHLALSGEGFGGVSIKKHDNYEIFLRLAQWAARD